MASVWNASSAERPWEYPVVCSCSGDKDRVYFFKIFFSSVPLGVGGGSASWEGDPQAGSSSVHVNDEELPAFDIAPSTRWHGTGFCAGPTRDIRHLLQCGNWRDEKEIIPSSHSRDTNTPRLYLLILCLR